MGGSDPHARAEAVRLASCRRAPRGRKIFSRAAPEVGRAGSLTLCELMDREQRWALQVAGRIANWND